MAKLTLQEQLLKAGLVTSKKAAKVERTAKKSRVQAREARAAVEENKKAQLERDKHPFSLLSTRWINFENGFLGNVAFEENRFYPITIPNVRGTE